MSAAGDVFTLTSRFKDAIDSLNAVTSPKFALVLSKLLTAVATKLPAFSDAEEEQLVSVLNLDNAARVHALLAASSFIFEQAVYYQLSPTALEAQLAKVSLQKTQRELFVACWTESASRVSARVRQRSIAPLSLTDSSWRLALRMSHADKANVQETRGVGTEEPVDLEFTHDQLSDFFQQLQTIQKQLDALR